MINISIYLIVIFYSNPNTNEKTTLDILQRAIKCCPELGTHGLDSIQVLENIVGFRPTRKGGPRIQNEFHSMCYNGYKKHFIFIHFYFIYF